MRRGTRAPGRSGFVGLAMTASALTAVVLGATRCGSGMDEGLGGDASLPTSELLPTAFSFEGIPGPWWKFGATRAQFEVDLRTCRDRSTEARLAAEPGAGHADAYRAFLECMLDHAWNRGQPTPHVLTGPETGVRSRPETSTRTPG